MFAKDPLDSPIERSATIRRPAWKETLGEYGQAGANAYADSAVPNLHSEQCRICIVKRRSVSHRAADAGPIRVRPRANDVGHTSIALHLSAVVLASFLGIVHPAMTTGQAEPATPLPRKLAP